MSGRVQEAIAEFGTWNGCLYLFGRILEKLTGRVALFKYYLYAQPVAEAPLLPKGRGRSIEIRPIEQGDPVLKEFPRPDAVIADRYRQGAVCFGAFKDGASMGFIWLKLGDYHEDEVRCCFKPLPAGRSAWDFDVYLHPQNRFSLAFPRLWDAANAHLREAGYRWSMSRISAFNAASLASHSKLGATRIGSTVFVSFGSLQLLAMTVFPYLRFSIGTREPVVRLSPPRSGA